MSSTVLIILFTLQSLESWIVHWIWVEPWLETLGYDNSRLLQTWWNPSHSWHLTPDTKRRYGCNQYNYSLVSMTIGAWKSSIECQREFFYKSSLMDVSWNLLVNQEVWHREKLDPFVSYVRILHLLILERDSLM